MIKIFLILNIFFSLILNAQESLKYYLEKSLKNNLQLNAERKNFESAKQNKNISRSEFLPSISFTQEKKSTTSTGRTDQNNLRLADSNSDSENRSISLEQKIFSGFKGVNTFKKSELETQKAMLQLKDMKQKTILDTVHAYYDLIYKFKNKKFNSSNVNLFERQVEFDNARVQKGEITLTDLAQSESSLAGANADLIKAETELLSSITNFERVTREKLPSLDNLNEKVILNLPNSLNSALSQSNMNNISLLMSKLDYEISVKELNIEKSRFSPSASISVSDQKVKILVLQSMKKMMSQLKLLLLGQLLKEEKIFPQLKSLLSMNNVLNFF